MTAVSPRKTVKLNDSEPNPAVDFLCGPCNVENKTNKAVGYCQYCHHYLCNSCFSYHRNLGKIHVLLNQDAMPKATPEYKQLCDPCIETCKEHTHKTIELYCRNHDEVCCVICVTMHHKKCDYVYIPDVTEKTGTEHSTNILQMIQGLIGQFENAVTHLTNHTQDLEKKRKEFGSAMRKFKKEVNEYLEDLERQVTNEIRQTYDKENKSIADNISKCEEAMKSLSATYVRTKSVLNSDKPNKTFTIVKLSEKHMRDMNTCLQAVHNNTFQVELKFEPNPEIMRSLKKFKNFGKIVHKRTVVKFPSDAKDLINSADKVNTKEPPEPDQTQPGSR